MKRKTRIFVGDFETTVYQGQTNTEVWASGIVEIYTEDVQIHHSIMETFQYLKSLRSNVIIYYHNLKFDGQFWLYYLITNKQYTLAADNPDDVHHLADPRMMPNSTYRYTISQMGQWYSIMIKHRDRIIEIRDSLKLLPFSVKQIGQSFKTKHQKIEMEYKGYRYAGCAISPEEATYISNDLLVVKEGLEILFNEGHTKATIGACCLSEFKKLTADEYEELFPNLASYTIPKDYGSANADEYIRKSYKGGWCYLVPAKENTIYKKGVTLDVNSLYPSMMSSESGNAYPVGLPHFWRGEIPQEAKRVDVYYFLRVKTRFRLKHGKLPTVQIKRDFLYKGNEWLETSDAKGTDGKYYSFVWDGDKKEECIPTLTLTCTDWELMQDQYDLKDTEILDGCWFYSRQGIFDEYIGKYKRIKQNSTGAMRQLAKLFLNNLYGKLATSDDSSYKIAYLNDEGSISFYTVSANEKEPVYVACGSAITSYSRAFTIRAAQANFYGNEKPGFIYADTDSIHCDLPMETIKGVKLHDTEFCCFKCELEWKRGLFVRQKTYIESEDSSGKEIYHIRCAGMPERSKELFISAITGDKTNLTNLSTEEKIFLTEKKELTDFKLGLTVPGNLIPKTIPGGVILKETTFQIR